MTREESYRNELMRCREFVQFAEKRFTETGMHSESITAHAALWGLDQVLFEGKARGNDGRIVK